MLGRAACWLRGARLRVGRRSVGGGALRGLGWEGVVVVCCHCGARSEERMVRRTRMPQGIEGLVANVEMGEGRWWDQRGVLVVVERREGGCCCEPWGGCWGVVGEGLGDEACFYVRGFPVDLLD